MYLWVELHRVEGKLSCLDGGNVGATSCESATILKKAPRLRCCLNVSGRTPQWW
jgi:hypothetical protein